MIDITDKGAGYLIELNQMAKRQELTRGEKTDREILSALWDVRELSGSSVAELDIHSITSRLVNSNPSWSRLATYKAVKAHIELLQPDCIERGT